MKFLVNELSFHGQFFDLNSFKEAIVRLMRIRESMRRFGHQLHCHSSIRHVPVMAAIAMPQAIQQALTMDQRRAFLSWITRDGPFWDEGRTHSPDEYFQLNDEVVTDTAVGEAAWRCVKGIASDLISIAPSNWQFSPLHVEWVPSSDAKKIVDVVNHWDPASLEGVFESAPIEIISWGQLKEIATAQCAHLTFVADAFCFLDGQPFVSGAAQRLLEILKILNRFKTCFHANGERTAEGNEIYQDFFTGVKTEGGHGATFTDSSDSEKCQFKKELTFKHPINESKTLFCSWHGKIQTPQLRAHFSWPVRADEPLYIVYVGPKLTKK